MSQVCSTCPRKAKVKEGQSQCAACLIEASLARLFQICPSCTTFPFNCIPQLTETFVDGRCTRCAEIQACPLPKHVPEGNCPSCLEEAFYAHPDSEQFLVPVERSAKRSKK